MMSQVITGSWTANVLLVFFLFLLLQIGEVPVEKSDIFVQYLRDNVPVGVTVQLELVGNRFILSFHWTLNLSASLNVPKPLSN